MKRNIILNTDSYKASHYLQYPPGTTSISSYIESRGGAYQQTAFFGLQIFINDYLLQPIGSKEIASAKNILTLHGLPFNEEGWNYILKKYSGFLPLEIQAIPEGTVIPTQNVMVQVMNTDPKCAWLTNYIETALLRAVWYPTTVATISYYCRQTINKFLEETADSCDDITMKLHDFGARGATSEESAAIGGLAHLVNFQGSDTLSAILNARQHYHASMPAFSIPAAEHSTITTWGKEHENNAYKNMLDKFSHPKKWVSVVSDSYDLWNAIDNIWGEELKPLIISSGGTLVIRPDSGDPISTATETVKRLMAKFGYQVNTKGYRVLPPYIRVIQGDGINNESIEAILTSMKSNQLSAENIAFGMGGALLQKLNRDTMNFAMKTSAAEINGQWQDVFKDPATDPKKRSKKGRLALIKDADNEYKTIKESSLGTADNKLLTVYKDGVLTKDYTLDEVRQNTLR